MAKKTDTGFKSEYFDTADDLVQAKNEAWRPVSTKRMRVHRVRAHTNMISMLAPGVADELNRSELTNFGLAYRASSQNESMFMSMVTGTNALVEITVDTDNPERDADWSVRMSEAVNRGAIHFKGKLLSTWRKVAGEITIAGGCPVMQNEKYGWLPRLQPDMFFPPETELDAEQITYAFNPVELSMYGLEKLLAAGGGEEGHSLNKKNIQILIEGLKEKIKESNGTATPASEHVTSKSVRGEDQWGDRHAVTIPAWWFYEVKYDKNEEAYVSATLFTDSTSNLGDYGDKLKDNTKGGSKGNVAKVINYVDKAYEDPNDWLTMVCVDSEIGGVKNMDTLRGISELIFPSSVEMEELFNLLFEGDKQRAKPYWSVREDARDAALAWRQTLDAMIPDGMIPVEMPNTSQGLQTPIAMLSQNVSSLTSSPVSNSGRDQELRQQAIERQQFNGIAQGTRQAEAYVHLDSLLETIVYRIFTAPVKRGTEGYNEIMWIRAYLDRYQIPYKKLAEKKHGRYTYISVRAQRMTGGADRQSQQENAEWMVKEIYPIAKPAARDKILRTAITMRTQNPDLAESVVPMNKAIINPQKLIAENECDTILRYAPLGQVLPVMPGDINADHVPIHLHGMQAKLALHEFEPWKRIDVIEFAAMAEHTAMHLGEMLAHPVENREAKPFLRDYQKLTASAAAITKEVEEREGSEVSQLTAKEQADLALKWSEHQLKAQQFGLKVEDTKRLWENREARATLSRRSQYSREITEDKRLKHDTVRLGLDAKKTDAQVKKNAKPKKKPDGS